MTHPIHRVTNFSIAGPYTIRVEFEDHTHQVIDFQPILAGNFYGPCETSNSSIKSGLTRKSTRWSGPMEPTLIPPPFMIGLWFKKHWSNAQKHGNMCRPDCKDKPKKINRGALISGTYIPHLKTCI